VEESLKAAAQQHDDHSDSFATRQSRNLQSLAQAAQKVHVAASSTASTRYSSNWGGSEAGGLTLAQRERIERWNNFHVVDKTTQETPPVTGEATLEALSDIRNLDVNSPPPPEPRKGKGTGANRGNTAVDDNDQDNDDGKVENDDEGYNNGHNNSDDDESSDGSNLESDFLKNFEALAYSSFLVQNYSKAEQLLRMAVERSTGDRSDGADFKLLKLKLALCCCLQEKWDHAAAIVASLSKARTPSNLPIFHLLQAISLAYLEGNRFDDAYSVCKSALNGKKKILGKDCADYYGCLTVFAAICEKRGNALEAEAVRHSIPEGSLPRSSVSVLSSTQYILKHETLIDSVFSGKPTRDSAPDSAPSDSPNLPAPDPARTGTASGHWSTLLPSKQRDGVQTAERDEKSGAVVEATDTGKELLGQVMVKQTQAPSPSSLSDPSAQSQQDTHYFPLHLRQPTLDPSDRPTQIGMLRPHQLTTMSGALHSGIRQDHPPSHQHILGTQIQRPDAPMQENKSWSSPGVGIHRLRPGASSNEGRTPWDQGYVPFASSQEAQRNAPQIPSRDEGRPKARQVFAEMMGGPGQEAEYVSTLQAMPASPDTSFQLSRAPMPAELSDTSIIPIAQFGTPTSPSPTPSQPRTRWIVPKDISNVGCDRPFGLLGPLQFLFTNPEPATAVKSCSVGAVLRLGAPGTFAISARYHQAVVFEVPYAPVCAGQFSR
jgi:hypothetical protein